jgi:hypothetical protein
MKLFQTKSKLHSVYVTIEKRINFYLNTLSIQCPAYEYYLEKLDQLKIDLPVLVIEEINTDVQSIKQCTSIYQRTKELVKIICFLLEFLVSFLGSLAYLSFRKIFFVDCMYFNQ